MSSWAYCVSCHAGLSEPTAQEVVDEIVYCPHCDTQNDPHKTKDQLIVELAERVGELEKLLTGASA
jgi:hypothetical protein